MCNAMPPLPADRRGGGVQQYWVGAEPYRHISVSEIAERFKAWKVGQSNAQALATPFPKEQSHKNALIKNPYALKGGFLPCSVPSLGQRLASVGLFPSEAVHPPLQ